MWFFLGESSAPSRTIVHGLDLTAARSSILVMKERRVRNNAEIGKAKVKVLYSKSDEFELFAKAPGFGEAQFGRANKTTLTLEMEYSAQVYEWNTKKRMWQ